MFATAAPVLFVLIWSTGFIVAPAMPRIDRIAMAAAPGGSAVPLRSIAGASTIATPATPTNSPAQPRPCSVSRPMRKERKATISGCSAPSSDMIPAGMSCCTAHQLAHR